MYEIPCTGFSPSVWEKLRTLWNPFAECFQTLLKVSFYIVYPAAFKMGIKRVIPKENTSANFHFIFKIHVVVGKTHILSFLAVLPWLFIFCFIIDFDYSEWWTVQKVAKTSYLYHFVLSHFKWNSFLRTLATYQRKFSSEKLNHENLITNEKRSLIESETDICLTRLKDCLFSL